MMAIAPPLSTSFLIINLRTDFMVVIRKIKYQIREKGKIREIFCFHCKKLETAEGEIVEWKIRIISFFTMVDHLFCLQMRVRVSLAAADCFYPKSF